MREVSNHASALGEAIGAMLEGEIHRILKPIAEDKGCIYVTAGAVNQRTGRTTKLILTDNSGNGYNIDSVIINNRFQPLVVLESKYIRYKKHNRDKASWICTAHTKLRERYTTIRKSIAVLMGNWSYPSRRLLESFEVELFHISFDEICNVLAYHDIPYNWAENNRQQAQECWITFSQLSQTDKEVIAEELIAVVKNDLRESLEIALDESLPRTVNSVRVVITSNRGETYTYNFSNLEETVTFLASYDQEKDMDSSNSPVLLRTSAPLPTNLELAEAIELDEDEEVSELDE